MVVEYDKNEWAEGFSNSNNLSEMNGLATSNPKK